MQTTFDAMGRVSTVSRPYTGPLGAQPPSGTRVTTTTYNALSQPVKIVDGGGGETDLSYPLNDVLSTVVGSGNAPTVSRQEEMDGLGRLQSVCEITAGSSAWPAASCGQRSPASGYLTAYTRDPLGDLTGVAQDSQPGNGGVEHRSFTFDQLGRLTSESNPETGTTSYTLDSDSSCGTAAADLGSLVKRVDNATNVTCYLHDGVGRVTTVLYPSGPNHGYTSTKHFQYDAATLSNNAVMQRVKGKLAEAWTGDAHTTDLGFSYPNPGANEVDVYQSSTNSGGWYETTAQHYANGATSVLTLPSGVPAITYSLDGEGRPTTVLAGSTSLVKSASYSADGLSAITFGSNDSDAYQYDASTGRMTQYNFYVGANVNVGTLTWNPNGSLGSLALAQNIDPSGPSTTCTYGHDDLGRISSVSCPGVWSQTFTLDPFGNVRKDATTGTSFSADFNLANQITTVGSTQGVYDPNGNLVNNPTVDTTQVNAFDSENRAVTLLNVNVLYDAFGRAAEANGNEILYGPGGGKLAVMNGQNLVRADVPLPGGAEAVYESGGLTAYRHADQLGSAPMASTPAQTVWSAVGYAPYGEAFSSTGSDRSFTGQKQDVVAGQYDFLMREYNPTQGRWWTPDPAGLAAVDPNSPQTWNRYGYVNGRPLSLIDLLGLSPIGVCPVAERSNPGAGTAADGISGPYSPDDNGDDAAGGNDGSCVKISNGFTNWTIDGVSVDSGLVSELELGGPGGTGAALDLNASSACETMACLPTIPGHDGNPQQIGGQWIPNCIEPGGPTGCYQYGRGHWSSESASNQSLLIGNRNSLPAALGATPPKTASAPTLPAHGSCAAASVEFGVGLVTTAAAGALVVSVGPEVIAPLVELEETAGLVEGYEAFEAAGHGAIGVATAALAPLIILGHGLNDIRANCF